MPGIEQPPSLPTGHYLCKRQISTRWYQSRYRFVLIPWPLLLSFGRRGARGLKSLAQCWSLSTHISSIAPIGRFCSPYPPEIGGDQTSKSSRIGGFKGEGQWVSKFTPGRTSRGNGFCFGKNNLSGSKTLVGHNLLEARSRPPSRILMTPRVDWPHARRILGKGVLAQLVRRRVAPKMRKFIDNSV